MQGQEGLTKLEEALCKPDNPFTVAFVDMRMPPGWDGVQTIQRLWQADPNVQVVICTAYSDYSWEEISKKLGLTDRLLILKKPFDPVEIIQIATSLSEKWSLAGKAQLKMDELEHMVAGADGGTGPCRAARQAHGLAEPGASARSHHACDRAAQAEPGLQFRDFLPGL